MTKQTTTTEEKTTVDAPVAPETSTALSPYEPRSLVEARQLATDYAKSGLVKTRQVEQCLLIMATGKELGIPATAALRSINVINDRPCPSADLLVALCLRSPVCDYFDCQESDEKHAVYVTRRRGRPERKYTYTIEEAERSGLISRSGKDGPWNTYRPQMLQHRCATFLARLVYPDLCLGLTTEEEMRDIIDVPFTSTPPEEIHPLTPQPETKQETPEERIERWQNTLLAATCAEDAKPVMDELRKAIPDAVDATRKRIVALKDARKAAGWVVGKGAKEEAKPEAQADMYRAPDPLVEKAAAETEGREPGSDG